MTQRRDRWRSTAWQLFPLGAVKSLIAVIVGVILVGCGDSREEFVPSANPGPAPPPAVAGGGQGIVAPVPVRPQAPVNAEASSKSKQPAVSDDDIDRLFDMGGDHPNFEVVSNGGPDPRNVYTVIQGTATDSVSTVTVIPPPSIRTTITPLAGFTLPEGFTPIEEYGLMAPGVPRRIQCDADKSIMAFVPAGEFTQGHDGADPEAAPAHPSFLDAFYMDIHEVTIDQYEKFRAQQTGVRSKDPVNKTAPFQHPVLGITYRDALQYAKWSKKTIPKEAEWEKAARGELSFPYAWGEGRPIWVTPRKLGQIDSVGSHTNDISPYGLFDMSGNAREWCEDWFDPQAYLEAKNPDGTAVVNWPGPKKAAVAGERTVKGGGIRGWEVWRRAGMGMSAPADDVGLRLMLRVYIAPQ